MLILCLAMMLNLPATAPSAPPNDNAPAKDAGGRTPLHSAHTAEQAKALLADGANIEARDAMGETPLHWAALTDSYEVLRFLLSRHAEVDARDYQGVTPLFFAARRGATLAVAALVAGGADVNARNQDGLTPLHMAAALDSREVIDFLIAKGARVDAADSKKHTPLFHAAAAGQRATLMALLTKGASLNAQDISGNTPLALAIISGHLHLGRYMVSLGADLHTKNHDGKTPVEHAQNRSPRELERFLRTKPAPVARFKTVWKARLSAYFSPVSSSSWLGVTDTHAYADGLALALGNGEVSWRLWKNREGPLDLEEVLPSGSVVLLLAHHAYHGDLDPNDRQGTQQRRNARVLMAVDARTGKRRWAIDGQLASKIATAQDRVFLVRDDALWAVDAKTGKRLWHVTSKPQPFDGLSLSASARTVVTQRQEDGDDNTVLAYAAQDGKPVWTTKLAGDVIDSPTPGADCFYVECATLTYSADAQKAATTSLSLWALDEATGNPRWHRELSGEEWRSRPVLAKNRVLVVTNNKLQALAASTGELLWSHDVVANDVSHDFTPVVAGDVIALWSGDPEEGEKSKTVGDPRLMAFAATSGEPRWTFPAAALNPGAAERGSTLSQPFFKNGSWLLSDGAQVFLLRAD